MKQIIFIAFLLTGFICSSQNLVPNGSFETYTACPNNPGAIPKAVPWTGPTYNSSDYYNACNSGVCNVPYYAGGGCYQLAKQGVAYAGIYTEDPAALNQREYLQVKLTDSLKANLCYYIEYFVNLFDKSEWATNNVAANLSKTQYTTTSSGSWLNLPQHITRYLNPVIKDSANWIQVAGVYSATGGERYLTLGNFKNDANTDTVRTANGTFGAYYLFDAVSMYSISPTGPLPWTYNDTTIIAGDSVYIGNYLGGSFTSNWYTLPNTFIGSGSGIYVKPPVTTQYVVQFTLCGVPYSDTLKVTVTTATGISAITKKANELIIKPNPNAGIFDVEITGNEFTLENAKLKIIDVLGKEISIIQLQSRNQKIVAGDLENGIYTVQICNGNLQIFKKLVINR